MSKRNDLGLVPESETGCLSSFTHGKLSDDFLFCGGLRDLSEAVPYPALELWSDRGPIADEPDDCCNLCLWWGWPSDEPCCCRTEFFGGEG